MPSTVFRDIELGRTWEVDLDALARTSRCQCCSRTCNSGELTPLFRAQPHQTVMACPECTALYGRVDLDGTLAYASAVRLLHIRGTALFLGYAIIGKEYPGRSITWRSNSIGGCASVTLNNNWEAGFGERPAYRDNGTLEVMRDGDMILSRMQDCWISREEAVAFVYRGEFVSWVLPSLLYPDVRERLTAGQWEGGPALFQELPLTNQCWSCGNFVFSGHSSYDTCHLPDHLRGPNGDLYGMICNACVANHRVVYDPNSGRYIRVADAYTLVVGGRPRGLVELPTVESRKDKRRLKVDHKAKKVIVPWEPSAPWLDAVEASLANPNCNGLFSYGYFNGHHWRAIRSNWAEINQRVLGVELEVELADDGSDDGYIDGDDFASELGRAVNGSEGHPRIVFQTDGSLEHGVEIISMPMGLDAHRDLWEDVTSARVFKHARGDNQRSAGLHVHLDRTSLGPLQTAKMVFFVNNRAHRDFFRKVARRGEGTYNVYHHLPRVSRAVAWHRGSNMVHGNMDNSHYSVVSVTEHTLEFRLFRSTTRASRVMAALQLVNAVADFCRDASCKELKLDAFLEHCTSSANRHDLRELNFEIDRTWHGKKMEGVQLTARRAR